MMRVLENGLKVRMATSHATHAVDTHDDLVKVSALMSETIIARSHQTVSMSGACFSA